MQVERWKVEWRELRDLRVCQNSMVRVALNPNYAEYAWLTMSKRLARSCEANT